MTTSGGWILSDFFYMDSKGPCITRDWYGVSIPHNIIHFKILSPPLDRNFT